MGKFINTEYTQAVEKISDTVKTFLDNPYYMWNDKKPTITTYYHINMEKSTMDESLRIPYNDVGRDSPFKYDRIDNFIMYGLERIAVSLEVGDFGLQSGEISGDCVILPGTIIPTPNDYFEINLATKVDEPWLFKVITVDKDTLDNGSNIWKITYTLEHSNNAEVLELVENKYQMIPANIGTRYTPILRSEKYDLVEGVDAVCSMLKQYFVSLFYKPQVQTFIFVNYGEDKFYDPYMIEFMIRNDLLAGMTNNSSDYIHVEHKITPIQTFALDYNRTFFKSVEDRDVKHLATAKIDSTADYIDDFGSIFSSRSENYFKMNYYVPTYDSVEMDSVFHNVMETFPKDIIPKISNSDLYTKAEILMNPIYGLYNIIIKYFNDILINEDDYHNLESMDFSDGIREFYLLPIIIFCLESFEKKILETGKYKDCLIGEMSK